MKCHAENCMLDDGTCGVKGGCTKEPEIIKGGTTMTDVLQALFQAVDLAVVANRTQPHKAMPHLYELLESAIGNWKQNNPVACGANCALCCHSQDIATFPAEALYIARTAKLDKAKIKDHVINGIPCCPLLDGDCNCGVYSIRPLICRAYMVPDKTKCNESYGAPVGLAVDMSRRTLRYQRLRLAPALLIALSDKTLSRWIKGDDKLWTPALFPQ